ncbi:MAG TPA: 4-hydroxy-tetrahydrodipicolinate reductase [Prolixibacteraceae bacterium]|nr:4-hydroxy-tetrahydrodipicolinate reductase [Prolixibacteraceae bacterium]HPT31608.1 4-hydroxy-tetrahydrodipicolinate reductase [Prolixibacteraceae bacterium]
MKAGLIGYGKMGKEIEKILLERGHSAPLIFDVDNLDELTPENLKRCDVVIEFTTPDAAVKNYLACFEAGVPVVSGTTGWLDSRELVLEKCREKNGTFFHTTNFSIGVNLFFELNRKLAEIMSDHPGYALSMKEVHHTQKLDAPSGTAITLAEDLISMIPEKKSWRNDLNTSAEEIGILSERIENVPGIHTINWESAVDTIQITHISKSRKGMALGAVMAAEYSLNHKGILSMKEMLNI